MTQSIPQVCPWLGAAESEAVDRVIARGWLTEGPESAEFSARLNTLIGAPFGCFAPNGTLALALGLMALEIGPGDEVLVPDITFIASANAVIMVGATPVFVDVEPVNYQIDLGHADRLVGDRTRAIMPVHLYGSSCDMAPLLAFGRRHGLKVIEDAAQGIGVEYTGQPVGAIGDVGCFSFFADKTITTGEGGYVVCRDAAVFDRLRYLRNQGRLDRGSFIHPMIGYNFRITDLQAAIGLAQLDRLPEIIARKVAHHAEYRRRLEDVPGVRVLGPGHASRFVPFRCVLIADRAAELMEHLKESGVEARGFFHPLHRQPCFADWPDRLGPRPSLDDADYPNAVHGAEHGLCLPIFPTLEEGQIAYVCERIIAFAR